MKNRYQIDWEAYASCARQAAADGAVLLRNENHALPITSGKVAVFGRSQFNYYKSGTGSGGAVNTRTVKNIIDVLTDEQDLEVNEQVLSAYRTWLAGHPFEKGTGWASEPWSQEEMPLSAEFVKEAHRTSEIAIIIIGRTAGEDMDNTITKGSFLLTDTEEEMLRLVCAEFTRTIVVLNVGNIIDMKWVKAYQPSAVLYTWQGGQEGAAAVGDVLTGRVNPSGKLTDTIAYDIKDYPSTDDFGGETEDLYREDIYVGYRYFETFAKKAVLYPFGYGLSYTTFEITSNQTHYEKGHLSVMAMVRNTGNRAGREVVQVYVEAPQGKLGKPARVLVGFAKTPLIEPGKEALVSIEAGDERFASYDDSGVTGFKSCFLLEEGRYHVYVGSDVRSAAVTYRFELPELKIVDTCKEALAPVQRFTRLKPVYTGDVDYQSRQESVPIRTIDLQARIAAEKLPQGTYAGDASGAAAATAGSAKSVAAATDAGANVAAGVHTLREVLDREITMQTFLSQLTDQDLCCIVRGEGMSSPKVTPGTAAAFGGVTERLQQFGIPAACCADGPSGIRMDCGTLAFSLPNGTCLASTFDPDLNTALFTFEGAELRKNRIESLLGPGMNIHRNPLNGRNFEYFSEDPLITGVMASAQLKGLHSYGVTGTIKHFAGNNQEHRRRFMNSVISERALREIYLKGFEIAVREGKADSIMTTYGAVNGIWTAGNFDLVTTILRNEWGYRGIVMTDWWAAINEEGEKPDLKNTAVMVRAQNDLYMVTSDSAQNALGDNLEEGLAKGVITRGHLLRSAENILNFIMQSTAMLRLLDRISEEEKQAFADMPADEKPDFDLHYTEIGQCAKIATNVTDTDRGTTKQYGITVTPGTYRLKMEVKVDASKIAQVPVTIFLNTNMLGTVTLNGTEGEYVTIEQDLGFMLNANNILKFFFAQGGMQIKSVIIEQSEAADLAKMFN